MSAVQGSDAPDTSLAFPFFTQQQGPPEEEVERGQREGGERKKRQGRRKGVVGPGLCCKSIWSLMFFYLPDSRSLADLSHQAPQPGAMTKTPYTFTKTAVSPLFAAFAFTPCKVESRSSKRRTFLFTSIHQVHCTEQKPTFVFFIFLLEGLSFFF